MIIVPCFRCYTAVRVMGEITRVHDLVGESSEYWPDKFHCVNCHRPCEGLLEEEVDAAVLERMKVKELSPDEMLAAQEGFGTPEEMICSSGAVTELFEKNAVKKVHGYEPSGTTRFIIDCIEFENGVRMHLAASPGGAVVFRISRPYSYTKKVLEEINGNSSGQ